MTAQFFCGVSFICEQGNPFRYLFFSFWCDQSFVEWISYSHNDDSLLFKLLRKKIWNMDSFKSTYILGSKVDKRHVWLHS